AGHITNTLVSGNTATHYGGGVWLDNSTSGLINTTIAGNLAEDAGGLAISASTPASDGPYLYNSVIYGNSDGLGELTSNVTFDVQHSLVQGMEIGGQDGNLNGADPELTPETVFMAPQAPG